MKPKLFIGCSSESLTLALAVQKSLSKSVNVQLWPEVFDLGSSTLSTLLELPYIYDFAVFILHPDDKIDFRGQIGNATRGNVLFELGLFMGIIGKERTFILASGNSGYRKPSDFDGVTVAEYKLSASNIKSNEKCKVAVKKGCARIRKTIDKEIFSNHIICRTLSKNTANSVKRYLGNTKRDYNIQFKGITNDENDEAMIKLFDAASHRAMKDTDAYECIKHALGQDFGIYVQSTAFSSAEPELIRYVNSCVAPVLGGITYLEKLMERRVSKKLKEDIKERLNLKSLGHWVFDEVQNPVPLAVVVNYAPEDVWNAEILVVNDQNLAFIIRASKDDKDKKKIVDFLFKAGLSLSEIGDRLEEIQWALNEELKDNINGYLGTTIRGLLYVPLHGVPGISLLIMTKDQIDIRKQENRSMRHNAALSTGPEPENADISLTAERLISIRLAGERLQGSLARRLELVRIPQD